jgi:general secretion pathway protein C
MTMKEKRIFYTPALLAFITVSAYFFADTIDTLIGMSLAASPKFTALHERERSVPPSNRELGFYSSVLDRGLFGDGNKPSTGPAAVASATYKLIGTVEGETFAGAVLADAAGQAFYRINRKLPDGSTLIKVQRNKVALRRSDGVMVDVEIVDDAKITVLPQRPAAGVKKLSGNRFLVDQKEVLASTENLSQILMQARALPYLEQGKIAGFRISRIVPNSIYAKIGLQNGDVIQQINSQALDDPGKFFQLYQGLRTESSISIDLLRGGRRQTMNYEIR